MYIYVRAAFLQNGFAMETLFVGAATKTHIVMYVVPKYMYILQSWLESCLVLVETPPPALDGE